MESQPPAAVTCCRLRQAPGGRRWVLFYSPASRYWVVSLLLAGIFACGMSLVAAAPRMGPICEHTVDAIDSTLVPETRHLRHGDEKGTISEIMMTSE